MVSELAAFAVLQLHTLAHGMTSVVPMAPPMPNVTSARPPGAGSFEKIISWAKWVSLGVCLLGLISAGAVMALQSRRGEGSEHLGRIGMALIGVVIISAASSLVTMLA